MQTVSHVLASWQADRPLLIRRVDIEVLPDLEWHDGPTWIRTVQQQLADNVLGIVLPLELSLSGKKRQQLYGVALLDWLRWSADEEARLVPVLAVAWQPLNSILSATGNLLLVREGTYFVRLPLGHADKVLNDFVTAVRADKPSMRASLASIERCARDSAEARTVTHHDLANDYYAAERLWRGYCSALSSTYHDHPSQLVASEMARAEGVQFEWRLRLSQRMLEPSFRQFQVLRRQQGYPEYPKINRAHDIVRLHIEKGLPRATRVLMIDDEFDQGFADVLLEVLFRQEKFTFKKRDEWVYSEHSGRHKAKWARMVCVRTASQGRNWLHYWGGERDNDGPREEFGDWLLEWSDALGLSRDFAQEARAARDVLGNAVCSLDDPSVWPKQPTSIVIMDLRLNKQVPGRTYAPGDFESVKLRNEIKNRDSLTPIIMFTASRQATTFATIMENAQDVDGWLTKESPDVASDDANSSRAVHYLLERVHLLGLVRDWYREEFEWDLTKKLQYAEIFNSPERDALLDYVALKSNELLRNLKELEPKHLGNKFLTFIQQEVPARGYPILQRLVARRIVVAALLATADFSAGWPVWRPAAFAATLPSKVGGRIQDKDTVDAVHRMLNFHEDVYFCTSGPELLSMLLKHEYEWLATVPWNQNTVNIRRVVETLTKRFAPL